MSDGALLKEVEWLETWLTCLEWEFVAPFNALLELSAAGKEVVLPRRRKEYFVVGFRIRKSVRANLRIAYSELQRRMVELAQQIATAQGAGPQ